MSFTEATEIYLINSPLSIDNDNLLIFDSESAKLNYFLSLDSLALTGNTFQKENNRIRVGRNIEELRQYNYVVYRNTSFTGAKWIYSFIEKMEYVNNDLSFVYIITDVVETWWHDLTFNKSFIERMHESLDTYNTLSDNSAHGQLIESKALIKTFTGGYFVFCSSDITQDVTTDSTPRSFTIGGYNIPCWVLYWGEAESSDMSSVMQKISNHGWADRVLSAVYVPFVPNAANLQITDYATDTIGTIHICTGINSITDMMEDYVFDFSTVVDYKKALTYPYAKIVVSDMTTGQTIELAPEKFANEHFADFQIQCSISETPSYRIIPKNYDGQDFAFNHALVVRCNTSLPTINNSYAKYMMMNGSINNMKELFAGIDIAGSIVGRSPMGVVTGIEQITNIVTQENQASKIPNQVTAINDGAMERINFNNGIKISLFTMDNFHMAMSNDYWKMYGYPIRRLIEPSLNIGSDYNYIKMVNPNILGGKVPAEDMREIESLFEKGVTLWHNPSTYKQY